jgi:drug/metabolite transporter (DMT)-like permease
LQSHSATVITFYEFISGVLFVTIFIAIFGQGFDIEFFNLPSSDYGYLFILASICTAYAFIASVYVMKHISPYSVVLAYNLEPIYGMLLALFLFPEKENMGSNFYYGAIIILFSVFLNGILKNKGKFKKALQKK